MPLNRPALSLGQGPRGVRSAREWVVGTFREIGRVDLLECAELGVSELVTNALLHGAGQITVRVRGTKEHPRVEVRDESTEPPLLPTAAGEETEDELLLTFGRGLSIVARSSDAWGAEIEDDGKVVWFAPAAEFSDDEGPEGQISDSRRLGATPEPAPADLVEVRLLNVPVAAYTSFRHQFRELRREVRLLALAHESDYPLARDLSDLFTDHGRLLTVSTGSPDIADAQVAGESAADLTVPASREAARGLARLVDMLDLTDAFGREERMLSLARTGEQRAFQSWFLGEFVAQADGAAPRPWVTTPEHQATDSTEADSRSSVS